MAIEEVEPVYDQTKSRIALIYVKDENTGKYVPLDTVHPLPIEVATTGEFVLVDDDGNRLKLVQREDGTLSIPVDTELHIDNATFRIDNIDNIVLPDGSKTIARGDSDGHYEIGVLDSLQNRINPATRDAQSPDADTGIQRVHLTGKDTTNAPVLIGTVPDTEMVQNRVAIPVNAEIYASTPLMIGGSTDGVSVDPTHFKPIYIDPDGYLYVHDPHQNEILYTSSYGFDLTNPLELVLDKLHHRLVTVKVRINGGSSTIHVQTSMDNINWWDYYVSATPESEYTETFFMADRYIRIVVDASAGLTADAEISAV